MGVRGASCVGNYCVHLQVSVHLIGIMAIVLFAKGSRITVNRTV